MKKLWLLLLFCCCSIAQASGLTAEGILAYEYGDSHDESNQYHKNYYLQIDDDFIELDMSDTLRKTAPLYSWLGKQVKIQFKDQLFDHEKLRVQMVELMGGDEPNAVLGSQPWVSILCKFSDNDDEPENVTFFRDMYANVAGGLNHYWKKVSYNNINVTGSRAVDWVDLPSPQSAYIPEPGSGSNSDRSLLFSDCTTAADPFVDFSDGFVGINMMFNDVLDCCAWGGGRTATLDGLRKFWRVTWEPPWSYANEGVIAHEMGHGFGLPHANNSDEDESPYDSPWDVMSSATGHSVIDPVYGRLGKHINMEFKRGLGWVTEGDGYTANTNSNIKILIDSTNRVTSPNFRFARIPLSDGTHYIVESRKRSGSYEGNLPDSAVIIHHVDNSRDEPPWVVDMDKPPATYSSNEGVMWKVGETFVDPIDGYTVEVIASAPSSFRVHIISATFEDLIYADGFE